MLTSRLPLPLPELPSSYPICTQFFIPIWTARLKQRSQTRQANNMFDNIFGSEPATPSDVDKFRADVKNGITQLEQLVNAIRAPVPTQTGDGTELVLKPDSPELIERINDTLSDIRHLGMTGIETLIQVAEKGKTGEWNDKNYLMERLIRVRSSKFRI